MNLIPDKISKIVREENKNLNLTGTSGILPDGLINKLIARKKIQSIDPIPDHQIQPASLDLRLGKKAYRIRASFIPNNDKTVLECAHNLIDHEFSIVDGAVLERDCVYLVELKEFLELPDSIWAIANPKSSTGRLDVFTRIIADGIQSFDKVSSGYKGPLYAEIAPHKFSIIIRENSRLSQLRFIRKNPTQMEQQRSIISDRELSKLHENSAKNPSRFGLVNGKAKISDGLQLGVSLSNTNKIIGYKAKHYTPPIDLDKIKAYKTEEYWDPLFENDQKRLILDPNEFYILSSNEVVKIPPSYAAEMVPIDPSMGELRVHYAGFFDPGFGDTDDINKASKAVLEVRSLDVPFYLEDKQIIARLKYEKLAELPTKLYGTDIGSTYQSQGLKLSKHFKD
jgi:dCTP deaminase